MKNDGKILVLLAILLPTLCSIAGLTIDLSLLLCASQRAQHIADAAATSAAMELRSGHSTSAAQAAAEQAVWQDNHLAQATVSMHRPPTSGAHAGSNDYIEVIVKQEVPCHFIQLGGLAPKRTVTARSVAGCEESTNDAAIVVLDPDPPPFQLGVVTPLLPPLPAILGGVEVLGIGQVRVDGAMLVNTTWGGKDEDGLPAGALAGPPYAVSATPLVSLTKLKARDLYVVGGVDNPHNYARFAVGDSPPLKCNRLPVPDPFRTLTCPTTANDAGNVKTTNYGGKTVVGLPIIGPTVTLNPGVYDYIEVLSGKAVFKPGIYIIRGKHPVTQLSLSMVAGEIDADGVMFYITNNGSYSATSGGIDSSDGESTPAPVNVATLLPSTVINLGLTGSKISGLNSPGSPFDKMLIFQRRHDRRPIVMVQSALLNGGEARGSIYSKWGHMVLAGHGTYDLRFAVGTLRMVALLDMEIKPQTKFPAAEDVFLVE